MAVSAILVLGTFGIAMRAGAQNTDGQVVPCPTGDGSIPDGSMCKVVSDSRLTLVSLGPELSPCERAEPPADALPDTCTVISTDESGFGTSAVLSYETQQGGEVRIGILPGGKQYIFGQSADGSG